MADSQLFDDGANVGVATATPHSTLEIGTGYLQLPTTTGAGPVSADCSSAAHVGRMTINSVSATSHQLCICPRNQGQGFGWLCSDFSSANGQSPSTPGITCYTLKTTGQATGDGLYWLDPDGAGGSAPFQAYCDMTLDGGGWTLVARYIDNPGSGNMADASALNTLTSPAQPGYAKLADTVWNQLRVATGSASRLRFNVESGSAYAYVNISNGVALSNNTNAGPQYPASTSLNGTYVQYGLGCNPHFTNWEVFGPGMWVCHHGSTDKGGVYFGTLSVPAAQPGTAWIR